ncbi:GTP-binding protein [Nocardia sp. SYP-A9097]|uniref:GTP-binding protein n=1 Tax=Nocardia sp. SYP-A9097 TaxID=2663237 RepID=UPI00129BA5B5|nr:GTP-binding protein [Nocardia sp. SYP-A9097]MRH90525.1 GTP-binding protein [Nocardia sp. SYP-A9097]
MPTHPTLNIGILAHVDAGKTSLTERLLFDTGAIHTLGSVDAGTTQTDTGAIEQQRGITVRTGVAAFAHRGAHVNVIDTPGHPDFVAEVHRAVEVLDAAILVVSAVEGVQSHTRTLMRMLRGLRVPTVVFVNKVDRPGARTGDLIVEMRRTLTPHLLAMTSVRHAGTEVVRVIPEILADNRFRDNLTERLADIDDAVLARIVEGTGLGPGELPLLLAEQTAAARIHPVYFGSARGGQGIPELLNGLIQLLPSVPAHGSCAPRGTVFALERSASGAKTAHLRLFAGALSARQQITLERIAPDGTIARNTGRIASLEVVGRRGIDLLSAGDIGAIRGLPWVRVGDRLAALDDAPEVGRRADFPAPVLRTLVRTRGGPATRLHAALELMSEHDPLLHVQLEPDGSISILLYGEIQKEIIAATLAAEFGIDAEFRDSEPIYVEQVTGIGHAIEELGHRAPSPSGYWATLGLRVAAATAGSGVAFLRETRFGTLPRAFHSAIEESVHACLRRGPSGHAITDCIVVLTHTGFVGPITTAADFRALTPIVLDRALRAAGTRLLEPYHRFEATVPTAAFATVSSYLSSLAADIDDAVPNLRTCVIHGSIAARHVDTVHRALAGITYGEGIWWSQPFDYRPGVD